MNAHTYTHFNILLYSIFLLTKTLTHRTSMRSHQPANGTPNANIIDCLSEEAIASADLFLCWCSEICASPQLQQNYSKDYETLSVRHIVRAVNLSCMHVVFQSKFCVFILFLPTSVFFRIIIYFVFVTHFVWPAYRAFIIIYIFVWRKRSWKCSVRHLSTKNVGRRLISLVQLQIFPGLNKIILLQISR